MEHEKKFIKLNTQHLIFSVFSIIAFRTKSMYICRLATNHDVSHDDGYSLTNFQHNHKD